MNNSRTHAKRLKDLFTELIKFSNIERQIYYPDSEKTDRRENDTEHSYSLAMSAWYLSQFIPELDQAKILKFALTHDLVEIHAGDVMAIGRTEEQEKLKSIREKKALQKLKSDWPDFTEMSSAIEEYERKDSKEALFVYALDKIMPMQLNLLSNGKTWKKLNIKRSEIIKNNDEKTKFSPEINAIWQELKKEILEKDNYFNPENL